MTDKPMMYVVVPVLNEAGNIPRLMDSLRRIHTELSEVRTHVLLVDDGSTDGTGEEATRLSAGLSFEVLRHPENFGPGKAFGSAFELLGSRLGPNDWVLTIEGDNTSRLELVRQMFTRAAEGFDVVLASPYLYGGGLSNTSAWRVFLSHVANVFVKEAIGLHGIVTMSSFFRLHRAQTLKDMQACFGPNIVDRRGFESMVEMLLKMVYLNVSISEVAMKLDTSKRVGESKMRVYRTAMGYLSLWNDKYRWLAAAERHTGLRAPPPTTGPSHGYPSNHRAATSRETPAS